MLIHLGSNGSMLVREIFANASSFIKKPATLSTLVAEIDKLDWYNAREEGLGNMYEGLLEKNANEKKSGAGQYFTPRRLIDAMVAVMQPTLADIIQDPAAGTGGFLIAANRYIREHDNPDQWTEAQQKKYARTGARIHQRLKTTLRVAVQRGILINEQGEYRLDARSIADYTQDECVAALLASLPRGWTAREDAIRAAARYLGFRRTGSAIHDTFKSAINGAIRRGLLEYDKELIRKLS